MVNNEFLPAVANYLNIVEMSFQHDGSPAHYSIVVRNWLDEHFPQRWFGRCGQLEYPSRSPDLIPPDFFLWGILKNEVYAQKPRTIEQLKENIVEACDKITADLCRKV
jgi:hypothetical protein